MPTCGMIYKMEFEFDKEMDALLRKAASSNSALTVAADSHLDADEISMFAENAMPDKAKSLAISHMADCDRCRTILSNVVALNSGETATAVPEREVVVSTAPAQSQSWMAGWFTTKSLAYGFGALALVFAGMISLTVFRSMNTDSQQIAQADNESIQKAAAPKSEIEKDLSSLADSSNSEASSNSTGDVGADKSASDDLAEFERNTSTTTGRENMRRVEPSESSVDSRKDLSRLAGERDRNKSDDFAVLDEEQRPGKPKAAPRRQPRANESKTKEENAITTRGATVRDRPADAQLDGAVVVEDSDSKKAAPPPPVAAGASTSGVRKNIDGKSFNRLNGIWYDSKYAGEPTIKVKRKTSPYRELDSGLRAIGDKLDGTIIVVWKTKAYRID